MSRITRADDILVVFILCYPYTLGAMVETRIELCQLLSILRKGQRLIFCAKI